MVTAYGYKWSPKKPGEKPEESWTTVNIELRQKAALLGTARILRQYVLGPDTG